MFGWSHRFLAFNQYSGELIYLAQGHKTVLPVGMELRTGFPRYREFGKGPGISETVFPVMKSPGICNFHHFSVNRPGIWFALEMSGPERSVRFKAANK